jgi:hypothetical protein
MRKDANRRSFCAVIRSLTMRLGVTLSNDVGAAGPPAVLAAFRLATALDQVSAESISVEVISVYVYSKCKIVTFY